ncbi:MAG: GspH/FimT family pseudopilin [Candidatus Competibacteraceae bacterium]|nr:GspH/FimT family pseudopilin [Candidatus Competibacteraceae bacterium]MBK7984069.1 GspH/FimT family pseudopilin [Candidatus Competibacteraceae bacterium]MBK8896046.1 GspH/FimT family pseudopilin [Candidatus Competibacteraceae bacterium]MBK8963540.1 GspH/FimT family pseudopilin [Candidatus Competibacteraceae bacterium]MBK9950432.1 GspH/FimT family pseudopilin [Candidatus Competibacteraceae bacterium]
MKSNTGFTLIELVVTMLVAVIVLTLGVPSFQATINNNRLTAGANELVGALHLARSEAIKRNVRVTLCKSANGTGCTAVGGYEQGWIVFVDPNSNATVDAGELVIRSYGPLAGGMTMLGGASVANYVSYVSAGMAQLVDGTPLNATPANTTLTLCKAGFADSARQLVLGVGGRSQVSTQVPATNAGCS